MTKNQSKTTWGTARLGDVATLHRGYDLAVGEMQKGNYPVVFSNGKIEYHNAYKVKGPGVVTGRSGTLGNIFYVSGNYWPHNTTLYVSDFHGNVPRFVYYLFKTLDFGHLNAGSGVPTLNRNHVHEIDVTITNDRDEQERIAESLSAFDGKIENNNRLIKGLEQMAQEIFKEWFIVPSQENILQKGWIVKKVSDIAKLNRGVSYRSSELSEVGEGVAMINLANFLRGGGFNPLGTKNYTGKFKETHKVKPGQILVAMTDITSNREIVGHPARVPESLDGAVISLDVCSIETEDRYIEFLYFLMLRKSFAQLMASSATGTNVSHLSKTNVEDFEFVLPDGKALDRFSEVVRPMVTQQDALNNENRKLITMRDFLLPRLMSGEIQV